MNLLHMKHALEVAKAGSLSKASEVLLIAVPNISRSIKELEIDLGIVLFERTQNGMKLTPEGEEFIGFAKGILGQIDAVERFYKSGAKKHRFSISVPRASYISHAFAQFSKTLSQDAADLFYKETNSRRTLSNMLNHDYKLGIIRYPEGYGQHFKHMLAEKGFCYEELVTFNYCLAMSKNCPLTQKSELRIDDLRNYIEIAHADPYIPSIPLAKVMKEELQSNTKRHIFVFERASQFELLGENPACFMWVSPLPKDVLERFSLVQKTCIDSQKSYSDLLIYKRGYVFSKLDKQFLKALKASIQEHILGLQG